MGLDMLHVPYKAAAAAHLDIIAGRIDAMFDNLSASRKYVQSGRLKALAVSAPNRASQLPNVPAINETGVVNFDGESWMGMFAPADTPPAIVDSLRNVLTGVIRDPDFAARIESAGGRVLAIPPQQQQQFLRQEIEHWGKLIAQYGVTAE
jgi:tripartite-type tricarboxylate transporter receptor subunit TctC